MKRAAPRRPLPRGDRRAVPRPSGRDADAAAPGDARLHQLRARPRRRGGRDARRHRSHHGLRLQLGAAERARRRHRRRGARSTLLEGAKLPVPPVLAERGRARAAAVRASPRSTPGRFFHRRLRRRESRRPCTQPVYILGGYQTDFARNWTKEGKHISAMMREVVRGALDATGVEPTRRRGRPRRQLRRRALRDAGPPRRLLVEVDPGVLAGCRRRATRRPAPRARSRSWPPSAEIEAGRYDLALRRRRRADEDRRPGARRRLPRHRRLVRARGARASSSRSPSCSAGSATSTTSATA